MSELNMENLPDSQKLIVIQNRILEMENDMDEAFKRIDRHHKLLVEGNGELPLMERMRNAETFIKGIKYWARLVAGAIVLQTITFGTVAFVTFMKVYPILERIASDMYGK